MALKSIVIISHPDYAIECMSQFSFSDIIGVCPHEGVTLVKGQHLQVPLFSGGSVIADRRCVFRFWKKEMLIESGNDIGLFYKWFPAENVTVVEDEQ